MMYNNDVNLYTDATTATETTEKKSRSELTKTKLLQTLEFLFDLSVKEEEK